MTKKKKKWIIAAAIIVGIIIFLNIPIVSDVIVMTRTGMIDRVVDVEKVEYEGEEHWLFIFRKIDENTDATVAYAVENSIGKATIRMWEPLTSETTYYTKPLIGQPYHENTVHFTPGEQPG